MRTDSCSLLDSLQTTFSPDERIAWAHILIPQDVLNGRTSEQWYDLNGKQGDGKEGSINIVLKLDQQVRSTYSATHSFHSNVTMPLPLCHLQYLLVFTEYI